MKTIVILYQDDAESGHIREGWEDVPRIGETVTVEGIIHMRVTSVEWREGRQEGGPVLLALVKGATHSLGT